MRSGENQLAHTGERGEIDDAVRVSRVAFGGGHELARAHREHRACDERSSEWTIFRILSAP